jgi:uncharacterized protein
MGWGFRRTFKIAPGVRVNLSKSGVSASIGGRGLTYNTRGKLTVSIPGAGIRYTENLNARRTAAPIGAAVAASRRLDSSGEGVLSKREQATRDFVVLIKDRTTKALQSYFISHGIYVAVDDLPQAVTLEEHQSFLGRLAPSLEVTTRAIKLAMDIGSLSLAEKEKAMSALYKIEELCGESHGDRGELSDAAISLYERTQAWPLPPSLGAPFLVALVACPLLLTGLSVVALVLIVLPVIYVAFRLKAFETAKATAGEAIDEAEIKFEALLNIEVSPRPTVPKRTDNTRANALMLGAVVIAFAVAAVAFRAVSDKALVPSTGASAQALLPRPGGNADGPVTNASTATATVVAYKTSFNCAKARSDSERIICSDAELAADDVELAAIYAEAKAVATHQAAFKDHVRQQWNYRQRKCHDRDCVSQWYADQKQWLMNIVNGQGGSVSQPQANGPSSVSTFQTSFDCSSATFLDDQAICHDPGLAAMDLEMAHDYAAAVQRGSPDKLADSQHDWVMQRRNCAGELNCLRHAYGVRIDQIQRWPGAPALESE